MSEWLYKNDPHMENLRAYCKGVLDEEDGGALFREYEEDIRSVKYPEVMALVNWMVQCEQYDTDQIKDALNRIINIFSSNLMELHDDSANYPQFIKILSDENQAITARMNNIKEELKLLSKAEEGTYPHDMHRMSVKNSIEELTALEAHYVKKENILFPYVEKYIPEYRCIQIMWSMHDDVRRGIKKISALLGDNQFDGVQFNRAIGRLFFDIYGLMFREDYILLPMSAKMIPAEAMEDMLGQCPEVGYTFIDAPEINVRSSSKPLAEVNGMVNLETGELSVQQLIMMLNTLPVDITYVDENDCVRYFSSPKDRIFPRSKAIIGRTVQNCHPPDSVHIVNEVVARLKSGKKDVENFWIQMGGKFILIQYFAIRDAKGEYRGTIEVSQEVSEIRELKGEKRLLDIVK